MQELDLHFVVSNPWLEFGDGFRGKVATNTDQRMTEKGEVLKFCMWPPFRPFISKSFIFFSVPVRALNNTAFGACEPRTQELNGYHGDETSQLLYTCNDLT